MEETKKETKMTTIFSMKLAGYLMMKGFVLVSMMESNTGNGKNVFFFNYSNELIEAIKNYKKEKKYHYPTNNESKDTILEQNARFIFKPHIARRLLKEGYKIIDLKPQKQLDGSVDYTRCVFVFEYADGINDMIDGMVAKKNN